MGNSTGAVPGRAVAVSPWRTRPAARSVRVMSRPVLRLPRAMPQPILRPVQVMPRPTAMPVQVMPRSTAKPVQVMPRSTAKPVRVMPRWVARPVKSAPRSAPSTVEFNRAPHTAANPVAGEQLRRRGATVVVDKVFAKIAGQAASEVAGSRGRTGGVLGIGSDADTNARPKVDVDLSSDSIDIDIAAGIAYPGSIRTAAQQIRDHVSQTVFDLTGVPVHRVDLEVTFLTTPFGFDGANGSKHREQALR